MFKAALELKLGACMYLLSTTLNNFFKSCVEPPFFCTQSLLGNFLTWAPFVDSFIFLRWLSRDDQFTILICPPYLICVKSCDLNFARKLTLFELDCSFVGSLETFSGALFASFLYLPTL